jgi:aminopeptidase N
MTIFVFSSLTAELHLQSKTSFILPENLKALDLTQNRSEIFQFLNALTLVEPDQSFEQRDESTLKDILNGWQEAVLTSDDIGIIQLYQRAVRNFNSFSAEKTEAITTYYKHYRTPSFYIPQIKLNFDILDTDVIITTQLTVTRNSSEKTLILDGRDQQVDQVLVNGQIIPKSQYKVTFHELILFNIPDEDQFNVEIQSRIDPFNNTTLEGMYVCKDWLTTQCESEGARRIFFTLDRPDVLSRITTTIVADKEKYPFRLSNGNLIHESLKADGRSVIIWEDPFPKPSYLFACVLGNFSLLTSHFTTRSGNPVELQVYVEPGKESRASYSLYALRKAMEFDELFFDREYDLSCLKMVGIPDFNSGAMENKGLMIFNDIRLLVDSTSGTDSVFREVARVIGHEYFHNWSGNRVTIRNWFEIALKEAFTDWRAIRFGEWLFGEEFLRPKDVCALKEFQFPEEYSEKGHPIMVESYVDAHSIYDCTTYIKGREIFRAFELFVDSLIPGGFREALNIYFSKNDGKAVTFRELLSAADEVLARVGKDSSQFERWFHQPGTPHVKVEMNYLPDRDLVEFFITQSCVHPKTGLDQKPFVIPFSVELIGKEGVLLPRMKKILDEEKMHLIFSVKERPTPIFMHGYSAPVALSFNYSLEDLARIVRFTDDAYSRWEACQNYSIAIIHQMMLAAENDPAIVVKCAQKEPVFVDLLQVYADVLKNQSLSSLAKAQILQIPSERALSQALGEYDFAKLARFQMIYQFQLALACKTHLIDIINEYADLPPYKPTSQPMQVRELKNAALSLLSKIDSDYHQDVYRQYKQADNFNDSMMAFAISINNSNAFKDSIIRHFYEKWKEDKAVFNYWLSVQASSPECTVEDLKRLESIEGYDRKNPNHVRSVLRTFSQNLGCYHDPKGEGYSYLIGRILEISLYNPMLAHGLAVGCIQDFENLPSNQQALMAKELKHLKLDSVPAQTRDLVGKILKRYEDRTRLI